MGDIKADESEPKSPVAVFAVPDRIRWERDDEEAGEASRPTLRRGRSLSISSMRSNAPIDPSAALPIQYRTL